MLKKFVLVAVLLMNFLTFSPVQAKIENVTGTGEYIMSMKETPEFAQQNAKLYAERAAIEQAGIFIASVSISKNFQLQDEITTFAAGLMKNINVIKTEMLPLTGNAAGYIKVVVTVEAQVDTDDFETALKKWQNKDGNEKSNLVEQDKSQQELIDKQSKRIKELEEKLANIRTEQDKQNVQQEIKQIDKEALYIQNKAIEFNPNDAAVYNNLGVAYDDLKQYDRAINYFNKAIKINPHFKIAYNNRGIAYYNLKNYKQAIKDYTHAIKLDKNYVKAYINRGLAYYYLENYDNAISDYNFAIKVYPHDADLYNKRGCVYHMLKNYEQAIKDYSKSISLDPDYAFAYSNRGIIYARLKNYTKAFIDLNTGINMNGNVDGETYYCRGLCYQSLGETEKAKADFAKARELGWKED